MYFSESNVLVIGDLMLDQYYSGSVKRISPEAPVPVVKISSISNVLGGSGNVVNNITHLGANCHLVGISGRDSARNIIINLLDDHKISYKIFESDNQTTTKLRVIGEKQQITRLDFENISPPDADTTASIMIQIENIMKSVKAAVISDYGKGFCSSVICSRTIEIAKKNNVFTIVDPKGTDWAKYAGASIVTPNLKELSIAAGVEIENEDLEIEKYGKEIIKKYSFGSLLVTRSAKGMTLITESSVKHITTVAKEVIDVSGAGDTVVAAVAVAKASGISTFESVRIANIAAGIVVSKFGTAPIEFNELHTAMNSTGDKKIISRDMLLRIVKMLRHQKKRIVFTNGCFDILHTGHTRYLQEAKGLGDILIVGLNSDASVKILKGPERPYNNENDRAELLASLASVDYIVCFDEKTPYDLIKSISPDVLVKGGDYSPENVAGREFSGEVKIVPFIEGYSSTRYINTIKNTTEKK